MSASELAIVVEGWATLAGLFVVIAGAVFAGVQLRQEARSRRLQAISTLLSDVRPLEVTIAWLRVSRLPDGFSLSEIDEGSKSDVLVVASSYNRLGSLLTSGAVTEREMFRSISGLSLGAIEAWAKLGHIVRSDLARYRSTNQLVGVHFEHLAARAHAYLLREGEKDYGSVPFFHPDMDAIASVGERIATARAAAS